MALLRVSLQAEGEASLDWGGEGALKAMKRGAWQRMSEKSWAKLCEALKFGSESKYELEDLGERDGLTF